MRDGVGCTATRHLHPGIRFGARAVLRRRSDQWHAELMTDADVPRSPRPAILLAVLAIVGTVLVGFAVKADPLVRAQEQGDLDRLSRQHTPVGDAVALAVNVGFGAWGSLVITLGIAVVLWIVRRSPWDGLRFALFVGVTWGAVELVKQVVQRPRPSAADSYASLVKEPASWSYPSGHTAFATALGLALVVVAVRMGASRTWVRAAVVFTVVIALVTAWSRMYLGVHHLSDVLMSMVLVPCVALAVYRVEEWFVARAHRRQAGAPPTA